MKHNGVQRKKTRKKMNIRALIKEMFLIKDMLLLILIFACLAIPYLTTIKTIEAPFVEDDDFPYTEFYDRIELIYYDGNSVDPFDFSNVEVIEVLDQEEIAHFIGTMFDIESTDEPNTDMFVGQCIRVVEMSGNFSVLACNYYSKTEYDSFYAHFDEAGKMVYLVGGVDRLTFLSVAMFYFGDSYTLPDFVNTIT